MCFLKYPHNFTEDFLEICIEFEIYVEILCTLLAREDCQARKLNKEDAMDRCKWRKVIKEAR